MANSMTCYKKVGNGWEETYSLSENDALIFERLSADLVAKKLHKCTYITRITDRPNYAVGGRIIEVTHSFEGFIGKTVYKVKF